MSQDPFDDLGRQLVAAAARTRSTWWRRAPRRGIAVALCGVSVAGTATAAVVVTQDGAPSAPAAGPLAAAPGVAPRSRTYEITVAPDLRAGAVGWCYDLQLRTAGRTTGSSSGCGPAWTAAMPLYGGGTTTVAGGVLEYAVVPPDVATVVFAGNRRIAPRPERSLPYDWEIAVLARPKSAAGSRPRLTRPTVRDAAGKVLPQRLDTYARGAPVRRLAGRPEFLEQTADGPALCKTSGKPRGFRVASAAVATGRPKVPELRNPAFLTCAATVLRKGRTRLNVAVLLNAENPAGTAAPLPEVPRWSTRRIGRAWLVVAGGSVGQRRATLAATRVEIP